MGTNGSGTRVEIQWGEGVAEALPEEPPPTADFEHWADAATSGDDAELCIRIVDASEIRALNARYRNRDEVTNVLSFPCDLADENGTRLLGDVVICAARIAEEASAQNKSLRAHFAHLVTHGVLHLMGYDHATDPEREAMEAREIALLAEQGYDNPYELAG